MKDIIAALEAARAPGSFYTRQTIPGDDLVIRIGEDKPLRFPVSSDQAKKLIERARPARFGKKTETLSDKSVRDTWEIPKSRVKIDKRRWNKSLHPLLENVSTGLGLAPSTQLKAELHNLLIYEPGQFFHPHQDSEKHDGMVATLVIILPCEHRGGSLVIDHAGDKKRLQSSRTTNDQLTCIAFYADCRHEVKPVTSGYRLALTYNLILSDAQTEAPKYQGAEGDNALKNALHTYFNPSPESEDEKPAYSRRPSGPPIWVYLLDHQYTQRSLKWNGLKNGDQLRADLIRRVAHDLNLQASIALADVRECWDAMDTMERDYRHPRRRYRYDQYVADDFEEPSASERYELNELIDEEYELTHWVVQHCDPNDYSKLGIRSAQVCWTKACSEFDPFESEYEGYMGNYGNTLDRWYHRAAVVLWREADRYAVLLKIDPLAAIQQIQTLAESNETRTQAQVVVEGLADDWQRTMQSYNAPTPEQCKAALQLALTLDDAATASKLVAPLGLAALNSKTARLVSALAKHHGEAWSLQQMAQWWAPSHHSRGAKQIEHFERTIRQLIKHLEPDAVLIRTLFDKQLASLQNEHDNQAKNSCLKTLNEGADARIRELGELLQASLLADNPAIAQQVTTQLMGEGRLYPPLALASLLLIKSKARYPAAQLGKLQTHVLRELNDEIAEPPRAPDDWSIQTAPRCSCNDCQELVQFLSAAQTREKIWPLAKARRQHIHGQIDGIGVPVSHQTRRQGSPHKLVLHKTDALFVQDTKRRAAVQKCLDALSGKRSPRPA